MNDTYAMLTWLLAITLGSKLVALITGSTNPSPNRTGGAIRSVGTDLANAQARTHPLCIIWVMSWLARGPQIHAVIHCG